MMFSKCAPPEAVDALRVVAHHGDVFLCSGQQVHQVGLHLVGVLVFIHEDVAKARLEFPPYFFVSGKQIPREGEEAREIHGLELFLANPRSRAAICSISPTRSARYE